MVTAFRKTSLALLVGTFLLLASQHSYAVNELSFAPAQGNPGQVGVPLTVQATNDVPIHSLSLALTYPTSDIDFPETLTNVEGVDFTGTVIEAASPPGGPDFLAINHNAVTGEITVGIILELMPSATPAAIAPSPTTAQDLLHLMFDLPASATPGDYPISFSDGIGMPPITNTFSSAGTSYFPSLVNGTLTVLNANTFRVPDVITRPGIAVVVPIYASHADNYQGFQVVLNWDSTVLDLNCLPSDGAACGITGRGTDADAELRPQNSQLLPGSEPWEGAVGGGFVEIKYEPGAGGAPSRDLVTVAAVFDFVPPFEMDTVLLTATPPGEEDSLLFFTFDTSAATPELTTTDVRLDDGLGSPPQSSFAILEGGLSVPLLRVNGSVTFDSSVLIFRRGNANQDGNVDLGDVVFILSYLFNNGSAPLCFDSADVNDDGLLDLSDPIYLITYLFNNGPFPPFPFLACGIDATDTDQFDCAIYNGGCP